MNRYFFAFIAKAVQDRGDSRGARARAAGERFTATPLPDAHFQLVTLYNFYKFRVYPFGEGGIVFKLFAELFKVQIVRVPENHAVRVAHWNEGDFVFFTVHGQRRVYDFWAF